MKETSNQERGSGNSTHQAGSVTEWSKEEVLTMLLLEEMEKMAELKEFLAYETEKSKLRCMDGRKYMCEKTVQSAIN